MLRFYVFIRNIHKANLTIFALPMLFHLPHRPCITFSLYILFLCYSTYLTVPLSRSLSTSYLFLCYSIFLTVLVSHSLFTSYSYIIPPSWPSLYHILSPHPIPMLFHLPDRPCITFSLHILFLCYSTFLTVPVSHSLSTSYSYVIPSSWPSLYHILSLHPIPMLFHFPDRSCITFSLHILFLCYSTFLTVPLSHSLSTSYSYVIPSSWPSLYHILSLHPIPMLFHLPDRPCITFSLHILFLCYSTFLTVLVSHSLSTSYSYVIPLSGPSLYHILSSHPIPLLFHLPDRPCITFSLHILFLCYSIFLAVIVSHSLFTSYSYVILSSWPSLYHILSLHPIPMLFHLPDRPCITFSTSYSYVIPPSWPSLYHILSLHPIPMLFHLPDRPCITFSLHILFLYYSTFLTVLVSHSLFTSYSYAIPPSWPSLYHILSLHPIPMLFHLPDRPCITFSLYILFLYYSTFLTVPVSHSLFTSYSYAIPPSWSSLYHILSLHPIPMLFHLPDRPCITFSLYILFLCYSTFLTVPVSHSLFTSYSYVIPPSWPSLYHILSLHPIPILFHLPDRPCITFSLYILFLCYSTFLTVLVSHSLFTSYSYVIPPSWPSLYHILSLHPIPMLFHLPDRPCITFSLYILFLYYSTFLTVPVSYSLFTSYSYAIPPSWSSLYHILSLHPIPMLFHLPDRPCITFSIYILFLCYSTFLTVPVSHSLSTSYSYVIPPSWPSLYHILSLHPIPMLFHLPDRPCITFSLYILFLCYSTFLTVLVSHSLFTSYSYVIPPSWPSLYHILSLHPIPMLFHLPDRPCITFSLHILFLCYSTFLTVLVSHSLFTSYSYVSPSSWPSLYHILSSHPIPILFHLPDRPCITFSLYILFLCYSAFLTVLVSHSLFTSYSYVIPPSSPSLYHILSLHPIPMLFHLSDCPCITFSFHILFLCYSTFLTVLVSHSLSTSYSYVIPPSWPSLYHILSLHPIPMLFHLPDRPCITFSLYILFLCYSIFLTVLVSHSLFTSYSYVIPPSSPSLYHILSLHPIPMLVHLPDRPCITFSLYILFLCYSAFLTVLVSHSLFTSYSYVIPPSSPSLYHILSSHPIPMLVHLPDRPCITFSLHILFLCYSTFLTVPVSHSLSTSYSYVIPSSWPSLYHILSLHPIPMLFHLPDRPCITFSFHILFLCYSTFLTVLVSHSLSTSYSYVIPPSWPSLYPILSSHPIPMLFHLSDCTFITFSLYIIFLCYSTFLTVLVSHSLFISYSYVIPSFWLSLYHILFPHPIPMLFHLSDCPFITFSFHILPIPMLFHLSDCPCITFSFHILSLCYSIFLTVPVSHSLSTSYPYVILSFWLSLYHILFPHPIPMLFYLSDCPCITFSFHILSLCYSIFLTVPLSHSLSTSYSYVILSFWLSLYHILFPHPIPMLFYLSDCPCITFSFHILSLCYSIFLTVPVSHSLSTSYPYVILSFWLSLYHILSLHPIPMLFYLSDCPCIFPHPIPMLFYLSDCPCITFSFHILSLCYSIFLTVPLSHSLSTSYSYVILSFWLSLYHIIFPHRS